MSCELDGQGGDPGGSSAQAANRCKIARRCLNSVLGAEWHAGSDVGDFLTHNFGSTLVVAGTRVQVDNVLAEVHEGRSMFDIVGSYPSLPLDGVEVCLAWEAASPPLLT
jgi:hypothetical protein